MCLIRDKKDTIMSSTTARTRVSERSSKAPRKFGDSPIPKARAAIDSISRELRQGSPKKAGRPRKKKTAEQVKNGNGSGGIGSESESSDRSHSSNPGDEDSTGGEPNDGGGDGGDGGDDDPTDSDNESSDDNGRMVSSRRSDPLLLDAF